MLFQNLFHKSKKNERISHVDQFLIDSEKKYFNPEKFERLCKLIMCDDPNNLIPECLKAYSSGDRLADKYDTILCEYFTCGALELEEVNENGMNIASSDRSALLDDFFWYLERIKQAQHVDFTIEAAKFDEEAFLEKWLYELARELSSQNYKVCSFSSHDDNYNFSVFTDEEADEVVTLANALFPDIALAQIVGDDTVFV